MADEELFLIRKKDGEYVYIHYDVESFEYWVGEGKKGGAVFTLKMALNFISETGLKKDCWVIEPTGVLTGDTEN